MDNNILVITQWGFKEGLIQSYTLPYLKMINKYNKNKIYLITEEREKINKSKINIINKELSQYNTEIKQYKYYSKNVIKYFITIIRIIELYIFIKSNRIKIVHSFCTIPGSIAYILSKFTNTKLIIDSYEPHSEYMIDAKVWQRNSIISNIIKYFEKKQIIKSTAIIATNENVIKDYIIDLKNSNYYIKPACVNTEIFRYKEKESKLLKDKFNLNNKIIGVYAGKLGDFYLEDELFEIVKICENKWKNFHLLLLSNYDKEKLDKKIIKYKINHNSITLLNIPFNLMPNYLSMANFAFSLYKPSYSKKYCTPIKNGEYWAVGLPIIIPKDISIDSNIIDKNEIGYVLEKLNHLEYTKSINYIDNLLKSNNKLELMKKITDIAIEYRSYSIAEEIYKSIYS
jgi:hypothetical protein